MPTLQQTLAAHKTYLDRYGQGRLPSRRGFDYKFETW